MAPVSLFTVGVTVAGAARTCTPAFVDAKTKPPFTDAVTGAVPGLLRTTCDSLTNASHSASPSSDTASNNWPPRTAPRGIASFCTVAVPSTVQLGPLTCDWEEVSDAINTVVVFKNGLRLSKTTLSPDTIFEDKEAGLCPL